MLTHSDYCMYVKTAGKTREPKKKANLKYLKRLNNRVWQWEPAYDWTG